MAIAVLSLSISILSAEPTDDRVVDGNEHHMYWLMCQGMLYVWC